MIKNQFQKLIKKSKNVLFYGSVFKLIDKSATVEADSFHFNKEWDISNRFQKTRFGRFELQKNSKLVTGSRCVMHSGAVLVVFSEGEIILGNNISFNNNCEVYCSESIVIGDDTIISNNCVIRDSDLHKMISSEKPNNKSIKIGKHVWVGTNSIILKGVTIGDGAVVAAGSVVVNDVPPGSLVAGNPAKVIKTNIKWER